MLFKVILFMYYILFIRNICVLPTHDVGRERYLTLLGALHTVDQKCGYRFLFFLKARLVRILFFRSLLNVFIYLLLYFSFIRRKVVMDKFTLPFYL